MDNKNNRQFFWQVKDFMTKKPNVISQPNPSSLVNTVNKVVNSHKNVGRPNIYEAKTGIVNSSKATKIAASHVLNRYDAKMDAQKPNCKAYSNNLTANLFNLFKK